MFISVYNLFYTSLPVLALGIFDQDVNDVNSLKYPKLFTPGHLNLLFNKTEFFKSAMHGCITSGVLFFIPYGAFLLSCPLFTSPIKKPFAPLTNSWSPVVPDCFALSLVSRTFTWLNFFSRVDI